MREKNLKEKIKYIIIGMAIMMVFSFASKSSIAGNMKKNIEVLYSDIKLVIDGVKITPKDSNGKEVEPFIYEGTTYLPIRAISELLEEQVDWDQETKTVYIGKKPKFTNNSVRADEFIKKHEAYRGNHFNVEGPGKVEIRQKNYNYFNKVRGGFSTYLVDGKYSKLKGVFLKGDQSEGGFILTVDGDDKKIFDGKEYLEEKGFENGRIERGEKNQPIEFEVDISEVEELKLYFGAGGIYNVEFIPSN